MGYPGKGRADYLALGDWNANCSMCGKKFKASELRRHWEGDYRCDTCWEPRHPQDFVRGRPDMEAPPWVQYDASLTFVPGAGGEDLLTENADSNNPYPYRITTEDFSPITTES